MAQLVTGQNTAEETHVTSEHVISMTTDFFDTMLQMDISPSGGPHQPSPEDQQAAVQIDGNWTAELRVIASPQLTEQIASAMFAIETQDLTEEHTTDALGEAANVIGGNVKGIVPGECELSLPNVGPYANDCSPENMICETFELCGSPLQVQLLAR